MDEMRGWPQSAWRHVTRGAKDRTRGRISRTFIKEQRHALANSTWIDLQDSVNAGVENYRRAIPFAVREGDAVLEVGCHSGTTTNLLNIAARGGDGDGCYNTADGGAIGIDIGPVSIGI